jgi:hypothetical protein
LPKLPVDAAGKRRGGWRSTRCSSGGWPRRDGRAGPTALALFLAGDDDEAKALVAQLIDEVGFEPVDSGSLAAGGRR